MDKNIRMQLHVLERRPSALLIVSLVVVGLLWTQIHCACRAQLILNEINNFYVFSDQNSVHMLSLYAGEQPRAVIGRCFVLHLWSLNNARESHDVNGDHVTVFIDPKSWRFPNSSREVTCNVVEDAKFPPPSSARSSCSYNPGPALSLLLSQLHLIRPLDSFTLTPQQEAA